MRLGIQHKTVTPYSRDVWGQSWVPGRPYKRSRVALYIRGVEAWTGPWLPAWMLP